MGAGDWLMATAMVRELFDRHRQKVMVVGLDQKPRWSEVFDNNPKIVKSSAGRHVKLLHAGGARPYIVGKTSTKWTWRAGTGGKPGEIYFLPAEHQWAKAYADGVMIEPNVKAVGHDNKAWPFERWQELVKTLDLPWVQCGGEGTRWLEGVRRVETPSFRHAAAVLRESKTFVGSEGGLMHAAAAVGKPSVILWSEFIDPTITGYTMHRNIRHAGPSCGSRVSCPGCKAAMEAITVDEVAGNLKELV